MPYFEDLNHIREACIAELKEMTEDRPPWSVRLSFEHSNSCYYDQAVRMAQKQPTYVCVEGDEELVIHTVIYSDTPEEYKAFRKLYDVVKNWKLMQVQIYGHKITDPKLQLINDCFINKKCYFSGPRELIISPWAEGSRIRIEGESYWLVNMEYIREKILRIYERHFYCPTFQPREILKELLSLPDRLSFEEYNRANR